VPIPASRKNVIPFTCTLGIVYVVKPSAPMAWRQTAETMARFGRPEAHLDRWMYNARTAQESERAALLGVEDGRARAVLIIGPSDATERHAHIWADLDVGKRDAAVTDTARPPGGWWTIWFAWTVKEQRRKGWAYELVRVASAWAGITMSEFLWETPFSKDGRKLVRKITIEKFWCELGGV